MAYELKDCLGYRMRRLSRVIDGYLKDMLNDFEITEKQMTIIFALFQLGQVEQGKVAKVLLLENSTISRNVKLLEKMEIVQKSADYRPKISLSPKGKKLADELLPLWNKTMGELIDKMGEDAMDNVKQMERNLL